MKKLIFIIISAAIYFSRDSEIPQKNTVNFQLTKPNITINTSKSYNIKKTKISKADENNYAKLEKELRELEDKLNDLPDLIHENSFTYTRYSINEMYQINSPDMLESLKMCEYKLEPNPEVVANFYRNHSEQIKKMIDKDGYVDLIDEFIPENNPYRNGRLYPDENFSYNCRTEITKIYISNEFRKLIKDSIN